MPKADTPLGIKFRRSKTSHYAYSKNPWPIDRHRFLFSSPQLRLMTLHENGAIFDDNGVLSPPSAFSLLLIGQFICWVRLNSANRSTCARRG